MQTAHTSLEVRHLRLVRAIAGEANVTRAARHLHLSQSAVSHQLCDLERDLGTRLFDRVGKRMVPTAAGAHLLAHATRLLTELADLERDLSAMRASSRPRLRITTSCYTSYGWLPTAIASFASDHAATDIDLVIEATRRAVPALVADEVDLAIVTEPPTDPTYEHVRLVDSELAVIAHRRHPVAARAKKGTLRWSALRDVEILMQDITDADFARLTEAVRESWRRESGQRIAGPVAVRKIPLDEALIELARAGRGVALVDRWTVERRLGKDLVALRLAPRAPRTFHAVWRRSNPRDLPVKELLEHLRRASQSAVL